MNALTGVERGEWERKRDDIRAKLYHIEPMITGDFLPHGSSIQEEIVSVRTTQKEQLLLELAEIEKQLATP